MDTILLILFIISYVLTGFSLFAWKMSEKSIKRESIKRLQRWNDLISNELLKGEHTQTEIASFIMKRTELLESELPENEFATKIETLKVRLHNIHLKIQLFFKRIRNKILYIYWKIKYKPLNS